jgi:uncharacterized membrane protein
MGHLNKYHMFEAGIWLTIATVFFIYSFEFNQNIEIYKFGATGWPRAVVLMLLFVMICHWTPYDTMPRSFIRCTLPEGPFGKSSRK